MRRVDGPRLIRGLALSAWALLFAWLWLSGKATMYVGPRTIWVVWFGAIALTVAAVAVLAGVRGPAPGRGVTRRDLLAMTALMAPVLCAVAIPAPLLGSLAVSQKAVGGIAADRLRAERDHPSLYAIAAASAQPEKAADFGIRPGMRVDIDGFVSGQVPGGIEVSRFLAMCCAADAVPYSITATTPPGEAAYANDTWLQLRGTVREGEEGFVLEATSVSAIDPPSNPYG